MKIVYAKLNLQVSFECPHCGEHNQYDASRDTSGDNDYPLLKALHERWNGKNEDDTVDTRVQNMNPFECDHCKKDIIFTNIEW